MMILEKPLVIAPFESTGDENDPILEILKDGPKTMDEMTERVDITRSTLRKKLKRLYERNLISKEPVRPCIKRRGRPRLQYAIKGNIVEESIKIIPKVIWLICPSCKTTGRIKVDKHLLKETVIQGGSGLMDVHVFQGDVCEHEFNVKIDCQLKVRVAFLD
ncbi:MAG: ArsR family transcriptional regulator [Candidatus Hodarchaeota archaeon]